LASGLVAAACLRIDYDFVVDKTFGNAADAAIGQGLRPDAIAQAAGLSPACVECVPSVESTNLTLMSALLAGDPMRPRVLIAARQTAGRGRRGRVWLSQEPDCLTMSISLHRIRRHTAPTLAGLSLALGVAIAQVLSRTVENIWLKWPNDLLRGDRKFAGMLVEARVIDGYERVVIGLGLNWCLAAGTADALGGVATGLFDTLPARSQREQLAGQVAGAMIAAARAFFDAGFNETAAHWEPFDRLRNRPVVVFGPGGVTVEGVADGLGPAGVLRLLTAQGVRLIAAGDVSVRDARDARVQHGREDWR
jgi:BirA family biotin operon repressor/biotin-[acetyl-CoA-carboxylase] ligase